MKKILVFIMLIFAGLSGFADELRLDKDAPLQQKINKIGFELLNKNNIEKRITFHYSTQNKVKVKEIARQKKIVVYKGIFPYVESDDELAALLAWEIAHLNDMSDGIIRRTAISYNPRKYERKADKKAVDYMAGAGFNPVAMIVIFNKITSEKSWYDFAIFTHKGSERMLSVYEHIYTKYPDYIANNSYLKNPYYQNFLHISKKHRRKIRLIREEQFKLKKMTKEMKND